MRVVEAEAHRTSETGNTQICSTASDKAGSEAVAEVLHIGDPCGHRDIVHVVGIEAHRVGYRSMPRPDRVHGVAVILGGLIYVSLCNSFVECDVLKGLRVNNIHVRGRSLCYSHLADLQILRAVLVTVCQAEFTAAHGNLQTGAEGTLTQR